MEIKEFEAPSSFTNDDGSINYQTNEEVIATGRETLIEANSPIDSSEIQIGMGNEQPENMFARTNDAIVATELTDDERVEIISGAMEDGVKLSEMDDLKLGVDIASFSLEKMRNNMMKDGVPQEEYHDMAEQFLLDNGYEIPDYEDTTDRMGWGSANTLMEMYIGTKQLLGFEVTEDDKVKNDLLFSNYKIAEQLYKGTDDKWDIAGGFGEALPAIATGSMAGAAMGYSKAALMADLAFQQALTTVEFAGTTELRSDNEAGTQMAMETAGNLVGFGIGRWLNKISTSAPMKEATEAITGGEEGIAIMLKANKIARENGVDVLGTDMDAGTALAKLVEAAQKNPWLGGSLKKMTDSDVEAMQVLTKNIQANFHDELAPNSVTAGLVFDQITNQRADYDTAIGKTYDLLTKAQDTLGSPLSNESYIKWLSKIKGRALNEEFVTGTGAKKLSSYIDDLIEIKTVNKRDVGPADMYKQIRAIVADASDASAKLNNTEARALVKVADEFDAQFGNMFKGYDEASGVAQLGTQARSLYSDRVSLFGYGKSGRKSDNGIITKFMSDYNVDAVKAMRSINSSAKLKQLAAVLPDKTMEIIKRNKFQDMIGKASDGGKLNFAKLGKELNKLDPEYSKTLFGSDYATIKGYAKLAEWVGVRANKLEQANILGVTEAIRGVDSIVGGLHTLRDIGLGVGKGKGLAMKAKQQAKGMIKDLEKKVGTDIDSIIDSINSSTLLGRQSSKYSADELMQGTHLDTSGAAVARQNIDNTAKATREADAKVVKQADEVIRHTKDIKAQTTQVRQDYTRAKTAIRDEVRVGGMSPKDKQAYNKLQQQYSKADHAGDLNGMTKASQSIDDHYNTVVSNNLKRAEAKAARAVEKATKLEQQALARADRARRVANARESARTLEASRQAEREVMRANQAIQEAESAQQAVRQRANDFVDNLPPSYAEVPEVWSQAINDSVAGLDGWTVKAIRGNRDKHIYMRSDTDGSYVIHINGDRVTATTTGLDNGSGAGKKIYPQIWDMTKDLGKNYKPDNTLLTANPTRMTMNMLDYTTHNGGQAPWLILNRSQLGTTAGRGSTNLDNKPLTIENTTKLARQFTRKLNSEHNVNINKDMNRAEVRLVGQQLGGNSHVRMGKASVLKLRNILRGE